MAAASVKSTGHEEQLREEEGEEVPAPQKPPRQKLRCCKFINRKFSVEMCHLN